MLERGPDHETLRRRFRWRLPARYNIGVDVCRHPAEAPALILPDERGRVVSFGEIDRLSNRLANVLVGDAGLRRGDRLGVLMGQRLETALAHVAAYKAGLVAVPLFRLFGPDALRYRLADCGARALVCDADGLAKVAPLRDRPPALEAVYVSDPGAGGRDLWAAMDRARDAFAPVDAAADDPAVIIYTSGTTGPPKGALHGHRVLLGHMPGVQYPHNFFPQPGDRFWTPADWAWIGGLFDVLLPAWRCGVPVVAQPAGRFDPEAAFDVITRYGVQNAFLPPTALKMMRQARPHGPAVAVRSVGSGGESLGAELLDWGRAAFGLSINEFYGQTECNLVIATCAQTMAPRPGWMGQAVPGHQVAVIGDDGAPLAPGRVGDIAVRRPDPVMFLEYWNQPQATAAKFRGDWLVTNDIGEIDADGWFRFHGRADDVIISAGYRIGPTEVEDCLLRHPAVAAAAVVGAPDDVRGEIVKAVVVVKPNVTRDDKLAADIQNFVKQRLAAHEYPRRVEFRDALPMTATGKIMRRKLRDPD